MSAFYVGQRVRIVGAYDTASQGDIGKETLIVGAPSLIQELHRTWVGYPVALDPYFWPSADCLEPIIPPGLESLDEINALYEPEPMRVRESEAFAIELYVAGICREYGG